MRFKIYLSTFFISVNTVLSIRRRRRRRLCQVFLCRFLHFLENFIENFLEIRNFQKAVIHNRTRFFIFLKLKGKSG
jgi:hypothetical protein